MFPNRESVPAKIIERLPQKSAFENFFDPHRHNRGRPELNACRRLALSQFLSGNSFFYFLTISPQQTFCD